MRRLGTTLEVLSVFLAAGLGPPALAAESPDHKLADATAVYHELFTTPDHGVPDALTSKCKCIAVIPHAVKGAFVYGARFGSGVMSCRGDSGAWSPPSFVSLTGGSVGPQIGAEASDLVLFFMTERGARSLMTGSKLTLGGQAAIAAGPIGRTGDASTDLKLEAEIYTYAKSKGLFAGLSISGARLAADKRANAEFYGEPVTVKQLLFEHRAPRLSDAAQDFLKALP